MHSHIASARTWRAACGIATILVLAVLASGFLINSGPGLGF
jgi:hypothetical protein